MKFIKCCYFVFKKNIYYIRSRDLTLFSIIMYIIFTIHNYIFKILQTTSLQRIIFPKFDTSITIVTNLMMGYPPIIILFFTVLSLLRIY